MGASCRTPTVLNGNAITAITCGERIAGTTGIIQGPSKNFNASWNHIAGYPAEFTNALKQPNTAYNVSPLSSKHVANAECNNDKTFNAVLVKKFHHWDRQHANGIKRLQLGGTATSDIQSLVIDMKLKSSSYIPTALEINTAFPELKDNAAKIDNSMAVLNFAFGAGVSKRVYIDQALFADKWIRITIPANTLGRGILTELNLTAEVSTGTTVMNLNNGTPGTNWLFKEVDFSIHQILYVLK